jgi:hypothetical protein
MPGIDLLELYCDEMYSGTSLTMQNVRRVRADLCNRLHCRADAVEDFSLDEVVDTLKGIHRVSLSFWTPEQQHAMAMAPLSRWDHLIDLGLDIHLADCLIVEGSHPSVCPNADPPLPAAYAPSVVEIFERLGQLPAGKTIHWIGYRAWQRNLCNCPLANVTEGTQPPNSPVQTSLGIEANQGRTVQNEGDDGDWKEGERAEEVGQPEPWRQTTPLSRLDLPRIVEAVQELYRIIEHPPVDPWRAPSWLVEQYRQSTSGEKELREIEAKNYTWVIREGQRWLIDCAATEVLNRIMPPHLHKREDCPEITDSSLDRRHKLQLIELRKRLSRFALGPSLVSNRCEALEMLAFLETTVELLRKSPTRQQPEGTADNRAEPKLREGTGQRPRKRQGRPEATDPKADKRLCQDWQAAKRQGISRDGFARERGITVQDLIDAQHREKYRRQRDVE